jgi:hypothetical protein
MKNIQTIVMTLFALVLLAGTALATPFESGSTCGTAFYNSSTCRGAYTPPTANTVIQLPPSGILDYTTFTVPAGYNIYFAKNAANTPVYIRASGTVTIAGKIFVNAGTAPTNSGTAGDGNTGDDGQPGIGGAGGYDGGRGGISPLFGGVTWQYGGPGKGPGGGNVGMNNALGYDPTVGRPGGGAGFGGAGGATYNSYGGLGGSAYGQATLLPLIGGSGGAGGSSGASFNGAGGGGGGGAILIASSSTINFANGFIYANGGAGGTSTGTDAGGGGGGGSGGAIRMVAETLTFSGGACYANGGAGGGDPHGWTGGGGADGRIRLEANTITGWNAYNTSPYYTFGLPGHVFVPNNPTLAIVSVTANSTTLNVPGNPTGNADISFPTGTTTATVNLVATGIPAGSTADVHVIPSSGAARSKVLSSAFTNGLTATATVTLSPGNNVLQAAVTYTVTETIAMNLPQFNGEYVAKIRVEGGMDGKSTVTYITASGKEYPADGRARGKA